MSETIKDGTGSGYLARVTSDNRLETYSIQSPYIEYATSRYQNGWNLNLVSAPLTGGVETIVAQLKNTDSNNAYIWNYLISYNGGDTNHNRVMSFNVKVGTGAPISAYVTANIAPLWVNLQKSSTLTGYIWDKTTAGGMVMANAGTTVFSTYVAQGSFLHAVEGSVTLPPGETITYSMIAEESGLASLAIKFYQKNEEL